jgi:hypothetical protein
MGLDGHTVSVAPESYPEVEVVFRNSLRTWSCAYDKLFYRQNPSLLPSLLPFSSFKATDYYQYLNTN